MLPGAINPCPIALDSGRSEPVEADDQASIRPACPCRPVSSRRRAPRITGCASLVPGETMQEGRDPVQRTGRSPASQETVAHPRRRLRLRCQRMLGAHAGHRGRRRPGLPFRGLGAERSARVSVIGDFNSWDGRRHPMRLQSRRRRLDAVRARTSRPASASYKYELLGADGARHARRRTRSPSPPKSRPRPPRSSMFGDPRRDHLARRGLDGVARAEGDARVASRSPSTNAISAPGPGCRRKATASSPTAELADRLIPYVKDHGLHPSRAPARDRVPV